jgi:phosphoribosyl-AMP cyclohydrolase
MFAYANREAVALTAEKGTAHYWTRSRQKLWHKGEESGHFQRVQELRIDCDGDVLIYLIEQEGGIACHTGRESCFYRVLHDGQWEVSDPVLKDPQTIYAKPVH